MAHIEREDGKKSKSVQSYAPMGASA